MVPIAFDAAPIASSQERNLLRCVLAQPGLAADLDEALLDLGTIYAGKGRLDPAISCFREAVRAQPDNADAHFNLGVALHGKGQLDEAIACYDRAIAADRTMTMAYLQKGGLCNRLARHSEALECYEQALRTQEKSHAA